VKPDSNLRQAVISHAKIIEGVKRRQNIQHKSDLNFELERELLEFGPKMHVQGPRILVNQIKKQLQKTLDNYSKAAAPENGDTILPPSVKK
jgi:uncharacterized protein YpbB